MATIKPFRSIQPNPFYARELVFPDDEQISFFGIGQKERPLLPLKEQLEAPARHRHETDEGLQQACQTIRENLENLLNKGRLRREENPGIYIYEIVHRNYHQTGVWALTSIQDYTDGRIKLHELTLADSERRIGNYRKFTGLEGSPVLLTYEPTIEINRIIDETCASNKKTTIGNKKSLHRIWKIDEPQTLKALIEAFKQMGTVYMADGHHRLAGSAKLAEEKTGSQWMSALYIAADQLRIMDYFRVILPNEEIHENILVEKLSKGFGIMSSTKPVRPEYPHLFGAFIAGKWYELVAMDKSKPDAVLLQEEVLYSIFNIVDPRTDTRLKCIGGEHALDDTIEFLRQNPTGVAFTLCPMSVKQLMAAADQDLILPPKSTWIDPKVPFGLLLFQHKIYPIARPKNHYD